MAAATLLVACGDDTTSVTGTDGNSGGTTGEASASDSNSGTESDSDSAASNSASDSAGSSGGASSTSGGSEGSESDTRDVDTDSGDTTSSGGDTDDAGTDTDGSTTDDSGTDGSTTDDSDTGETETGGTEEDPLCGDLVSVFSDDFSVDLGQWQLDAKWAYADGGAWGQMAGDGVMASAWNVGGGGCPTTQRVVMTDPVDLGNEGTLRFAHSGELAELDTLRVIASTDDGATWEEVAAYDDMTGPGAMEAVVELDVAAYGGGPVRFGFEYDNVCGDPLGVTWVLDDVAVCEPELCEGGQVVALFEDFEGDDGAWILGTHWLYDDGVGFAQPGDGVMAGYWDQLGFAAGCPTTQRFELAEPVDLFGNASLAFSHAAQLSTNDTLRVLASSDDGLSWDVVGEWDSAAGLSLLAETQELLDLSAIAAEGPVRIAFEFDNICGDALGVEWGVDDVLICTDPAPSPCGDAYTTVFADDFEADAGNWVLGTHWMYADGADFGQAGDGVMAGIWDTLGFAAGCPTTQRVEMANTVVAGGVVSLRFSHAAQLASNDTLRVLVSTDDGATWETVEEYDDADGLVQNVETLVELDLSPWAGPVRVAFEFDNVCGDALGVEWGIDDVLICEQDVLPT